MKTLRITRLGSGGEGIADHLARPVKVPFTLPGETVVADVQGDRAVRISLLQTSPDRTAPGCPHFAACGGCAAQHMATKLYRDWKRSLVAAPLNAKGLGDVVGPLVDASAEGRRRATLHVRRRRVQVSAGFMAARTRDLVDIDQCPLLVPLLAGVFDAARELASCVNEDDTAFDIVFTAAANGVEADMRGLDRRIGLPLDAVARAARRHGLIRLSRHGDVVFQSDRPHVACGRATVEIPPGVFLQATAEAERVLSDAVVSRAEGARRVADLFCGVGPFALRLAEIVPVAAFDADRAAIAALAAAGARTPGLKPLAAAARDLFRSPLTRAELRDFDTIVLNPPRQGAESQCRQLAACEARRVIMVSCNPATFARDADILVAAGYRLGEVTPVDQFLFSPHIELVALFVKPPRRRM